jgi:fatty acid desaturase
MSSGFRSGLPAETRPGIDLDTMEQQRRHAAGHRAAASIEWPTVLVAAATYAAFALLTWHYDALPWWLLVPLGGYVVALHGSLQHETIHGHPTPWSRINDLLVWPSLWLWMPYRIYRDSHLLHHRNDHLTDPLGDPESFYVTPEAWTRLGPLRRGLAWGLNTLAGRLLLGPAACALRLYGSAAAALARGDTRDLGAWLQHAAAAALTLFWVIGICGVPLAGYLAFFAYPGLALTLLRSFLEHRAREAPGERSVVVEAGPVMSLLYLNNNLHALHHAEPGLAWYRLPARYRARRDDLLSGNGGYRYAGYLEVAARYLLKAKEPPVHPLYHVPAFIRLRAVNDPGPVDGGQEVA